MALDKAILSGKEHRRQYTGGKAIDRSCRNHGGCPACEGSRLRKYRIDEDMVEDMLEEYFDENEDCSELQ